MSKMAILFGVWCAVLTIGAAAATWLGWSPYAEASGSNTSAATGGHGGYGGGHFYGPMHK